MFYGILDDSPYSAGLVPEPDPACAFLVSGDLEVESGPGLGVVGGGVDEVAAYCVPDGGEGTAYDDEIVRHAVVGYPERVPLSVASALVPVLVEPQYVLALDEKPEVVFPVQFRNGEFRPAAGKQQEHREYVSEYDGIPHGFLYSMVICLVTIAFEPSW